MCWKYTTDIYSPCYNMLPVFTIENNNTRTAHTSAKAHNNKEMGKSGLYILYPDGDPDDFQNLMGSNLDQDPCFHFYIGRSN